MKKIICILGPTASGKSNLAINLSDKYNLQIISVDSVMVYKDFNIGTSKPSKEILSNIKHRLIDIKKPNENYSTSEFIKNLYQELDKIYLKNKIPLLVGGSMQYFNAFFQGGLSDTGAIDLTIRKKLESDLENDGLDEMYKKLSKIDNDVVKNIHQNDKYRILRMLEIYFTTGDKPSRIFSESKKKNLNFNFLKIALLTKNRQILHNLIIDRMNFMFENNFIEEVSNIRNTYGTVRPLSSVGYKQVVEYLDNKSDYDNMKEKILYATRQLAKRQLTWIRHMHGLTVHMNNDSVNIDNRVEDYLNK
ncbi:MAG: tRNA (adenosine(37)-N6)-dimethylallyltransferase MiaA [Gammaproteobacteria bacterium]|nr:tRNA (adenosine(37)-N6)-dimethylallyltransferase MiaA [Gammaproteobacteria bacterium]|tara:strand:+ start:4558 stop:5472 length:915 start_codon:yes stop_codon:yes gene_type:complete